MTGNTEVATEGHATRILYVITKANWGGAQRYVFDMATASKLQGYEVLVVSGTNGPLLERLEEADIATYSITSMQRDVSIARERAAFKELHTVISEFKPDIIHGNSSKAGFLASLAGRLAGVRRIVFTAHGWAFNEQRPLWQKAMLGFIHYLTVLLSHQTLCVSHAVAADAAWMPFVQKRILVIHIGIEPIAFLPKDEARAALASDLARIAPTPLWIGSIAELHPNKGLDTLIEAFASIAPEYPSTVLVLVGEGQDWAHLQKLVEIYDLPSRVVLAGFVPDASRYLPALDIFALPSRTEALGYTFLEAGLAALPAVGTRVGGIPEVLDDGATGLLVPMGDVPALANALRTLIEDASLRRALGVSLQEKVASEFSKEAMVAETMASYRLSR